MLHKKISKTQARKPAKKMSFWERLFGSEKEHKKSCRKCKK